MVSKNYLKANAYKCHLLIWVHTLIKKWLLFIKMQQVATMKNYDSEVTFANYIENFCRKTSQKLHALARVTNFMTLKKALPC